MKYKEIKLNEEQIKELNLKHARLYAALKALNECTQYYDLETINGDAIMQLQEEFDGEMSYIIKRIVDSNKLF